MASFKVARILLLAACLAMSCQRFGLDQALPPDRGAGHNYDQPTLLITAETDTTVRLNWPALFDHPHGRYQVWFREAHALDYEPVALTDERYVIHNPHGKTGWYRVTLSDQLDDRPLYYGSTVPVHSEARYVSELNARGFAGHGWEAPDRVAGVWPMYDMSSAAHVDFYLTNFRSGWAPPYFVASPHTAPQDPGFGVSPGPWNNTGVCRQLADENGPLPAYSAGEYGKATMLDLVLPRVVGIYTHDHHFAVIKVVEMNAVQGYVRIESWFQTVPNLRLVAH